MPLTIRAMRPEDIPHVLDACSAWEELSSFGLPYWRPRSAAELQRKIADTAGPQPATAYSFVILDDNRLVGECSLHAIDWRNRHAQVGICIWRPDDRRRGHGKAGVTFLISWATQHLGLHRVEAWILEGNDASIHLFSSLGFQPEGVLRQRYWVHGAYKDIHVYAWMSEEVGLPEPATPPVVSVPG